ncbi:MAG: RDD family protein [Archangium sp.]|nr:RDD family protein [Archangium sp.]
MSDGLQVATPERVAVDLPVAGLGSRAMAYVVDVGLLGATAMVTWFAASFFLSDPVDAVLGLSNVVRLLMLAGVFFLMWIYWTLLEVLWHGQTPGKRLLRIRVVKNDGSPVTVFSSAVRNLLRVVDFLPACYPVGLVTMLVDKKHRRLGDLLAGTVLVRDEQIDLSRYEQVTSTIAVNEVELATSFLSRFEQFEPAAQLRLGTKLAAKLGLPANPAASAVELRDAIAAHLKGPVARG